MDGFETFYREDPIDRQERLLPASLYNLAYLMLQRSGRDCLFVPIRSMQYMAVIDREEIIFAYREARQLVEIAWQDFRPQVRERLDDPVPYTQLIYLERGFETVVRLQGEFAKALIEIEKRHPLGGQDRAVAEVVSLLDRLNDK